MEQQLNLGAINIFVLCG